VSQNINGSLEPIIQSDDDDEGSLETNVIWVSILTVERKCIHTNCAIKMVIINI